MSTAAPATKRKERKGEQTVRRILDAAEPLFAERGYEATSLRAIAGKAGLTQPGLYKHFESKEALYAAVLDRALAPMAAELEGHFDQLGSHPPRLGPEIGSVMTDILVEHPLMSALFQRALQGDPTSTGNRMIKRWLDRLFGEALRALEAHPLPEVDRVDLALQTIALFNVTTGFFLSQRVLHTLVGRDVSDPEIVERQKSLVDILVRATLTR